MEDGQARRAETGLIQAIQSVIKGMLFLGFTVQILLGLAWMCCNLGEVQDFDWNNLRGNDYGGALSALCGKLYAFLGQTPFAVYVLQLVLAFYAGFRFLKVQGAAEKPAFRVWGSLALLTFPFAMQCHLAVLPYSAAASLFLLMLAFFSERAGNIPASGGKTVPEGAKRRIKTLAGGILCGALAVWLAAAGDADEREHIWGRGAEAALASRLAWPGMWYDLEDWPEEIRILTEKNLYRASAYPGNMRIVLEDIARGTDPETAEEYYLEIAKTGWKNHKSAVIRQIGWDVLGYGFGPLVVPLQLKGRAYDSYTGRNYESMGSHTPVLTGYYVYYGCWWFGCCLILSVLWHITRVIQEGGIRRKALLLWGMYGITALAVIILYTIRGSGLMDYRRTIAIHQLWLVWGLVCMIPDSAEETTKRIK